MHKSNIKERITGYIKLMRPYGALNMPLTVVFSALCNGQFDFFPLLGLFIIIHNWHICPHFWFCSK
jgi:hypothetical protein